MLNETLQAIALRRLRTLTLEDVLADSIQLQALQFELGQLGFKIANSEAFTAINRITFEGAIATLTEMRGGNVRYVPLFTNFPDQLPNDHIYLIRRILGFLGLDTFDDRNYGADPVSQMQVQSLYERAALIQSERLKDSHVEWIDLTVALPDAVETSLCSWAQSLVYSPSPVKEALWDDIFTVLAQLKVGIDFARIVVKETLARLAAYRWERFGDIIVRTPTDLLRMFAFMRGQDVSLASKVDLKGLKFSKPQRRAIVAFLNACPALEEDLLRYRDLWINLSRWIHPGDYAKPFPRVASAFDSLRRKEILSFEAALFRANADGRLTMLAERPSMLVRKLAVLAREVEIETLVTALRLIDSSSVPLPLLLNAYCALADVNPRLIINKQGKPHTVGARASTAGLEQLRVALGAIMVAKVKGSKDWAGLKVWADPAIDSLVLPLQSRKQSDGLLNLGRGSRIPLGDSQVLRLFMYWKQSIQTTDLDLSVMVLSDEFNYLSHVGWNQYHNSQDIAHSGDIQSAPLGAAELIDIRLSAITGSYLLPAIVHYGGESFTALDTAYAGWMRRQEVNADYAAFDAKTVVEKVNVNQDGKTWIPFMVDLEAQQIIYVDLYSKGARTVESNKHFPATAKALASFAVTKPTYGLLVQLMVAANGASYGDRDHADVTIGVDDGCDVNVLKLVGDKVLTLK